MSAEILIVDDNTDIRNIINELIIDAGYKTRIAANYNQALAEIDKKLPDVAILDVKLDKGDNDGIELLSHIKTKNRDVPVIIISGHANIEMAIKSLHHGAFEFIEKPFDQERLLNFVSRAVENFNLKTQNKEYENKLFSSYELIGESKNTINILDQIKKISLTESRVFIYGPSGSGKELVARKIHKNSSRKKNPFIICFLGGLFSHLHGDCIEDVVHAISQIRKTRPWVEFHLYGQRQPSNFLEEILQSNGCIHHGIIMPLEKKFDIMEKAHCFIVPSSFNPESHKHYRYSFPTKLPELLASGRPILSYGPSDTSTNLLLNADNLGIRIHKRSVKILVDIFENNIPIYIIY